MIDLSNKTVVLVMPCFFGYQNDIIKNLESRGASVIWMRDRPFDRPIGLLFYRLFPSLMLFLTSYVFKRQLKHLQLEKVDIILAVDPVTLATSSISMLKQKFSSARCILYLWDSIDNRKSLKELLPYFDKKLSFDPRCSEKYDMLYRPLFYRHNYAKEEFVYDASFVGTVHSDRYLFLSKIKRQLSGKYKLYFYFFIHAYWLYLLYKITHSGFKSASWKDFSSVPLSKEKLADVFASSKIVVDIEHPHQQGLTMRTLETLGARKKLITTNKNVVDHDFYNSENICIVDRDNPLIPDEFMTSTYTELPEKIYYKYSLSGWLDEILL